MEKRCVQPAAVPSVRMLALAGALAALSCAATLTVAVPTPTGGYVNPGDAVVLLGAYVLGGGWGAAAGALGPALADLLGGYGIYAPATLVIKGLMALAAGAAGVPGNLIQGVFGAACAAVLAAALKKNAWARRAFPPL